MKKILTLILLIFISLSPVFKGLFFPYEMYIFYTAISALSALYFIIKIIKKEEIALKNWSVYLGIALILAYVLSSLKAVNTRANMESILQYTVYFIVFLVMYDYFSENIKKIPVIHIVSLVGFGFINAIIGLAGYTKVFPALSNMLNGERIGSTFEYANTAAIYFLMLIVLTISLIINVENIFIRSILSGIGNVIFLALFFTSSRGVFLVVPVVAFLILILVMPKGTRIKCTGYILCVIVPILAGMKGFDANSKIMNIISASKWVILSAGLSAICALVFSCLLKLKISSKAKYITAGVVSVVTLIVVLFNLKLVTSSISAFLVQNIPQNVLIRIKDINLETWSVFIRFQLYKDALKLISANWLFGLGGGGFASSYQSVQDVYYAAKVVHNHYLQVFVESGILGFLSFVSLTALTCVYFIYARVKIKDDKVRVYIAGLFCAFLALALHSAIDFNLSYGSMCLIYWSLIGISTAYYSNSKKAAVSRVEKTGIKRMVIPAFLVIVSLVASGFSMRFIKSSSYTKLGDENKKEIKTEEAIENYEEAARIDSMNAANHAELADLYSWNAYCSKTAEEKNEWLRKAIKEGEEAVRLDAKYPYYNSILTNIYFQADMYIKACEQAQKLVALQPRVSGNYELLARGYMEAGLQYLRDGNIENGGKYIISCSKIDEYPDVKMNANIQYYKGKALLLLGNFKEAEELLTKAREGSLDLKMTSDRLLYIINEETGRESQNSKYKGVAWMGVVKLTPEYKEVKQILGSGILAQD